MASFLCALGHVASYRELLAHFNGQASALEPFIRFNTRHTVVRLRANVYVCAHLDSEELSAARVGGLIDCVSVLARHGLGSWHSLRRRTDGSVAAPESIAVGADGSNGTMPCLHLRMRRNDGRASARRRAEARDIRTHWAPPLTPLPTAADALKAARRTAPRPGPADRRGEVLGTGRMNRLEVPLLEALRQALTSCLTPEESLAVLAATADVHGRRLVDQALEHVPAHRLAALRRAGL